MYRFRYTPAQYVVRNLRNRVIVITGASSGIGAATSLACAQAGMHVVLAARRQDRLQQVADQIQQLGGRALPVVCNVERDEDVQRLIQEAVSTYGRLDAIFANAGTGLIAPVAHTTDRMVRDLFEINFFGTLRCIRAALPVMQCRDPGDEQGGHILVCSSCVSEISLPKHGAYCATKAAQDSIAQSLRAELSGEGIYVSTVHPVTTRTEFFERAGENSPGNRQEMVPHDFLTQSPERVARTIVRCLRRPCPEVWPHLPTRFGVAVCTAFPRLTAYAMRWMMTRS